MYQVKYTYENGKSIIETYKTAKECKAWVNYTNNNSAKLKIKAERIYPEKKHET